VNECKPLPSTCAVYSVRKVDAGRELSPAAQVGSRLEGASVRPLRIPAAARAPVSQGLTLVHFSAQLERFLWDRGCA